MLIYEVDVSHFIDKPLYLFLDVGIPIDLWMHHTLLPLYGLCYLLPFQKKLKDTEK